MGPYHGFSQEEGQELYWKNCRRRIYFHKVGHCPFWHLLFDWPIRIPRYNVNRLDWRLWDSVCFSVLISIVMLDLHQCLSDSSACLCCDPCCFRLSAFWNSWKVTLLLVWELHRILDFQKLNAYLSLLTRQLVYWNISLSHCATIFQVSDPSRHPATRPMCSSSDDAAASSWISTWISISFFCKFWHPIYWYLIYHSISFAYWLNSGNCGSELLVMEKVILSCFGRLYGCYRLFWNVRWVSRCLEVCHCVVIVCRSGHPFDFEGFGDLEMAFAGLHGRSWKCFCLKCCREFHYSVVDEWFLIDSGAHFKLSWSAHFGWIRHNAWPSSRACRKGFGTGSSCRYSNYTSCQLYYTHRLWCHLEIAETAIGHFCWTLSLYEWYFSKSSADH